MCRTVFRHFHPIPVYPNETILSMQTGVAIKIQWNTRSARIFIYSAFLLPVLCRTHSRILKDGDFNLHINVCTSCKECRPRPGASITVRRWARVCTLCISPVQIYSQVRRYTSGTRPWSSLNANSSFPHYLINL